MADAPVEYKVIYKQDTRAVADRVADAIQNGVKKLEKNDAFQVTEEVTQILLDNEADAAVHEAARPLLGVGYQPLNHYDRVVPLPQFELKSSYYDIPLPGGLDAYVNYHMGLDLTSGINPASLRPAASLQVFIPFDRKSREPGQ
jgi:hypothetical protein